MLLLLLAHCTDWQLLTLWLSQALLFCSAPRSSSLPACNIFCDNPAPSIKPPPHTGRLQTWFFQWEGLLIGGVFVGGLGIGAVKVYLNERLDDLGR